MSKGREPLLASDKERFGSVDQRLGAPAAVQSLVVSMLGTGIVAFPYGFALCGYIVAPLALVFVAWLAHLSYVSLIRCTMATRASSYGGLLQEIPSAWRHYSNISLWLLLVLVGTAYTIIAADIIRSVAAALHIDTQDFALLQNRGLFAVLLLVVFPPSLSSSFEGLTFISTYCTLAIAVSVVLMVWQAYEVFVASPPLPELSAQPYTDLSRCLLAVPIFSCAMFGHQNISQIYAELRPTLKARANLISVLACTFTGLLYLAVGSVGYAAFGRVVLPDVIAQLTARTGESTAIMATQGLLTSFVVLKMPLVILPLRVLTLEMMGQDPGEVSRPVHVGVTVFIIAAIYATAMAIPDFGKVLELLGAVCVIPLTFIVPARLAWSLEAPRPTGRCILLFCFGVLAAGLALAVMATGG